MDSKQSANGIADGFISRIIKFFFLNPLLLEVAFVFVLSILLVLFTTGGVVPYILLPINGSLSVSFVAWKLARRWKRLRKERSVPEKIESDNKFSGEYLKNLTGLPAIFTYETIEIATGGFSKEIGKGGFGTAYEEILEDDTLVAVKCLVNESRQGQAEFCAEIGTTPSINHSNLVRLHGICVEGQHRILVYEFMANGSLDRGLFDSDKWVDWKTRYSIALDTARGLAYLHEESRLCILHLDVKPQNILVDEDFKAKVSDFSMTRCLKRDIESHLVTGMRCTPGYMAPEWLLGAGITSKSDVFSYGMDNTRDSDNWYFPSIAINKERQDKMEELIETGLEMKRPEDPEEAYRFIKTVLWCIQINSGLKPSMGTVVRILEGDLEIMDPPSEWTLPFAPSVVYLKPTSDITLSVAEDTDMACECSQEAAQLGNVVP